MTHEQRERAIVRNMQALGITRKEAEDLIDDDEAVDRGESLPWDLTPEQMKQARKYANASTRKSGGAVNRTKKENPVMEQTECGWAYGNIKCSVHSLRIPG